MFSAAADLMLSVNKKMNGNIIGRKVDIHIVYLLK